MINRLKSVFEVRQKKDAAVQFWFGGELPEQGFFGANEPLSREEARDVTIVSHHIFMFPFTMEKAEGDERDFSTVVREALSPEWKEAAFSPANGNQRYSEYYYFHPFVREAMFGKAEDGGETEQLPPLMTYFVREAPSKARFKLQILSKDDENKEIKLNYALDIQRVALRIYDTRIGILCLELINRTYEDLSDILKINDYGRRIYPQFLGKNGIADTKGAFLPDCVELEGLGSELKEDFADTCNFRKDHPVVAGYIQRLLGDGFTTDPAALKSSGEMLRFQPTIDDRMYTVCWYGSERWSKALRINDQEGRYAYQYSDKWYQFIFIDGNWPLCSYPKMKRDLIHETTYQRWVEMGTFYGISRYSLVAITDAGDFSHGTLREHLRRHYAQMAALLLAQRASILRFSHEVTRISRWVKGLDKKTGRERLKSIKEIQAKVERLHADYIRFVNRMWFTEITPQEQGIEMYNKGVENMHLKADMEDLKAEIKELYEFISMLQDRAANTQMGNQTILGTIFLPLVALTGFFGMNLMIIDNSYLQKFAELLAPHRPDSLWSSLFHWTASLAVLVICFGGVMAFTRCIIRMLDGKDSDILDYLNIARWFKCEK